MRLAIHQPNYFPWLGYFFKMLSSDVFIFLDDVQYTKNSFINRVQVKKGKESCWLTVPVSFHFGDSINVVKPANSIWMDQHINLLANNYRGSSYYREVMLIVQDIFKLISDDSIADINCFIIKKIAILLEIDCQFVLSSEIDVGDCVGDDRLVKLAKAIAPDAFYLSGKGGSKYQNREKFIKAGLGFEYLEFEHPIYDQGMQKFVPCRSILDVLYNQGIDGAKRLLSLK
jgi:hypothetical protein